MEAKVARDREELFRKYARSLERRAEEGPGSEQPSGEAELEAGLLVEAAALMGAYRADPSQRFKLVRFYEVAENALRAPRGPGLRGLERAFATLETVCANLLLFPWKKEFRCIKTFTGPYVYYLQGALCEADLRSLLLLMGYSREQELQFQARDQRGEPSHLRQLAFELFLARAECQLLAEAVALVGDGASEAEVVEARRVGCEGMGSGDGGLVTEASRLSVRPVERGRGCLRRGSAGARPSRSVDVTDGAGSWQPPPSRPILRASLSLRKEPLYTDVQDDLKDEILHPAPSPALFSAPSSAPSPSAEVYPYPLSSLDDVDLYTECGVYRQPLSRPPSREPRDSWGPKPLSATKCQGCGRGYPSLASCHRCHLILCSSCHAQDPSPCCGGPSPSPRPLDGYLPAKEKQQLSVYTNSHGHSHSLSNNHTHSHSPLPEKPLTVSKLYHGKPLVTLGNGGGGGSRCGFCNKPAASHTCMSCSKVSCDSCIGLYAGDTCSRKNVHHTFISNHQLNYKASTNAHTIYR
ncbi:spermatogenesis-associated protein 2-like [Anguilla rostrata]|uniref:spermatogenesis-associated protein 2-like n=1 Tax=Anguilla rostrata TaxID=7938 RepID=UPI0030D0AF39